MNPKDQGSEQAIRGAAAPDRPGSEQNTWFMKSALDQVREAAYLIDDQAAFQYVNREACRMLGYSEPELLALGLGDIDPDLSVAAWTGIWLDLKQRRARSFEAWHRRKDGSRFPVEVNCSYFEHQGKACHFALVRDISERMQAQAALLASEAMQHQILENLPAGVLIVDPASRRIERVNAHVAALFGAPREFLEGQRCHAVLCPASEGACPVCDLGQAVDNSERVLLRADGSRLPILKTVKQIEVNGQVKLLECFIDISERKRAEAEQARLQARLQQAQKLESLALLAGGVAHDMNNVLGAILGLASASQGLHPSGSPAAAAFETIAKAATRGGTMVKGLLALTRQSPAEQRDLDLNGILQEEARLLERTTLSRVRLQLDLAADLRPIRGDASALAHAVMNLCVNAVDAMTDQGTLTLRTRNLDPHWTAVVVEDTGSGMAQEVLDRALDPFFTTKEVGKGTGLGLSMVYSTVKAHQGQLDITSQPGRGTRVELRFPAISEAPAPEPATRPAAQARTAMTVLLVDDDELIRSSMRGVLEVLGHQAVVAASGEEALAQVQAGLAPDVAILDMNMPGLGGAQTLPRLRALRPDLPVLLATGRVDQAALDLVRGHSRVALLGKPFSVAELREQLDLLG